jgi:hypothetical protein
MLHETVAHTLDGVHTRLRHLSSTRSQLLGRLSRRHKKMAEWVPRRIQYTLRRTSNATISILTRHFYKPLRLSFTSMRMKRAFGDRLTYFSRF